MGNTVHQVLVQAVGKGIVCAARALLGLGPGLGMVDGGFAVGNLLDELLRLMDAVIHAGKDDRFAVKAGGLDVLVRRNNNAVAGGDFLCRQHVLGTVRAVGFHLGGQTQLIAHLGQGLRRHIGVGNAVGAGCDRQHAVAILGNFLLGKALLPELGLLLRVNGIQKLCGGSGGAQLGHKVLVHQHLHHTRQHINVQAAVFRRGNGK